jgi:hypothetical protein
MGAVYPVAAVAHWSAFVDRSGTWLQNQVGLPIRGVPPVGVGTLLDGAKKE